MTQLTSLLVGTHFHPPAKALLAHLPSGTPVVLRAEPENPYDEKAISVWLDVPAVFQSASQARLDELEGALIEYGSGLADLAKQNGGLHMLGHVAATGGKPLRDTGFAGTEEFHESGILDKLPPVEAILGTSPDGKWTLTVEVLQ